MALTWDEFCQLRASHGTVLRIRDGVVHPSMATYKDIPDLDAIHAAMDDPHLRELRCPLQRREGDLFPSRLAGGSVLDAVIYVTLNDLADARFKAAHDTFKVLPKRLDLIRALAARHVPAVIYGDLQWLSYDIDRYALRGCMELIVAAGLEDNLKRIDGENCNDFLNERLVMEALVNGWPNELVAHLRKQGASTRLVINEAMEALHSLNDWQLSPLHHLVDFEEFLANHPNFPDVFVESMWEIENLNLPVVDYEDRMRLALAWHDRETHCSDLLMMTLSKKIMTNTGIEFHVPEPAMVNIDAFLFGERIEICTSL